MRASDAGRTRSYGFATTPAWIIGHVLVIAALVVMVNLGLWQLRRLDERRAANHVAASRLSAPAATVDQLVARRPASIEFRRVVARGAFDRQREVLAGYRSHRGLPGYHVITPLVLPDGRRLLVNRGFVPLELANRWPVPEAAPPQGEVEVVGVARESDGDGSSSVTSAGGSKTPVVQDVDVVAIGEHFGADVLGFYVELERPVPPGFPEPLPEVDLDDGPHRSYAMQWFSFATITAVGWVLLLRRRASRARVAGAAGS